MIDFLYTSIETRPEYAGLKYIWRSLRDAKRATKLQVDVH